MELSSFGESLQGFAKILGTVGQFVATGDYIKQASSRNAIVTTDAELKEGSLEIATFVHLVCTSPLFSGFIGAALGAFVQYVLSKRETEEMEHIAKALEQALEMNKGFKEIAEEQTREINLTNKQLLETVKQMATGLTYAAKQATAPIGKSCTSIAMLDEGQPVVKAGKEVKSYLNKISSPEYSELSRYTIKLIGLNLDNGECVVCTGPYQRLEGKIIDPGFSFSVENNPYLDAFAHGSTLKTIAKAQLDRDGKIEKLFIVEVDNMQLTEDGTLTRDSENVSEQKEPGLTNNPT